MTLENWLKNNAMYLLKRSKELEKYYDTRELVEKQCYVLNEEKQGAGEMI